MKSIFTTTVLSLFALMSLTHAQVEIDKPIELTGGTGDRYITNLESPVNSTDAVNKAYVDASVSAGGGSGPTEVSTESVSTVANFGDALRYCNTLTEGGHSDWYLPTFDEITFLMSKGGITISNNTSANAIWTRTKFPNNSGSTSSVFAQAVIFFRMSTGEANYAVASGTSSMYARCVR